VNAPSSAGNNMDDLMGIFGSGATGAPAMGDDDLMNGFASLNMSAGAPAASEQMASANGKKNNEDILGLF
jgi:AP-1 complex subunit beta-1